MLLLYALAWFICLSVPSLLAILWDFFMNLSSMYTIDSSLLLMQQCTIFFLVSSYPFLNFSISKPFCPSENSETTESRWNRRKTRKEFVHKIWFSFHFVTACLAIVAYNNCCVTTKLSCTFSRKTKIHVSSHKIFVDTRGQMRILMSVNWRMTAWMRRYFYCDSLMFGPALTFLLLVFVASLLYLHPASTKPPLRLCLRTQPVELWI